MTPTYLRVEYVCTTWYQVLFVRTCSILIDTVGGTSAVCLSLQTTNEYRPLRVFPRPKVFLDWLGPPGAKNGAKLLQHSFFLFFMVRQKRPKSGRDKTNQELRTALTKNSQHSRLRSV